jgi:hypothetical protein
MANNNPVNVYPDPDGGSKATQHVEEPVLDPASSPDSYGTATNDDAPAASPADSIN